MTNTTHATLYDALIAAGIPVDSHESDLYFPVSERSTAILRRHPRSHRQAEQFVNQAPGRVGERWWEVPFAYVPWWEDRARADKATAKVKQ